MGDIYQMPRPFGISLFSYAYVGTLKSYVYMPFRDLFEYSAAFMRFPVAIIILITGFMSLLQFYRMKLTSVGLVFCSLLLAFPESNSIVKNDFGFVSFHNFVAVFSVLAIYHCIVSGRGGWAKVLMFTLCFAALYSHLKFIWTINALYASAFFCFFLRERGNSLFGSICQTIFRHRAFLLGYFFLVLCFVLQTLFFFDHPSFEAARTLGGGRTTTEFFLNKLLRFQQFWSGSLTVNDFGIKVSVLYLLASIPLIICLLTSLTYAVTLLFKQLNYDRELTTAHLGLVFSAVMFLAVVTQLLIIRQADTRWHVQTMLVHGLLLIAFGYETLFRRWEPIEGILPALLVVMSFLQTSNAQLRLMEPPTLQGWPLMTSQPPALDKLAVSLSQYPNSKVRVIGWGIAPMLAFDDTKKSFLWDGRPLSEEVAIDWLFQKNVEEELVIRPTRVTQTDVDRSDTVFRNNCIRFKSVEVIQDELGREVYDLGSVEPLWNDKYYLELNPDIEKAVDDGVLVNGFEHWSATGVFERRRFCLPD